MALQEILWTIQNLPTDWRNILDILLVASIFFAILQLARGTRAATLLRGIVIFLIAVWSMSGLLNLEGFTWLLRNTLTALVVAVPVIFQDEIRRWLDRLGRFGLLNGRPIIQIRDYNTLIEEICDAVRLLSRQRYGALIVLERETGLQEYIDSGITMDAVITSALLQTTFFPKTPLHDGAVIIRDNRATAGACTLPLSGARNLPDRTMGLRHRAALGLSEVSDSIIVVVSEETGRISVVDGGQFIRGIDTERLAIILGEYIRPPQPPRLVLLLNSVRSWFRRRRTGNKAA